MTRRAVSNPLALAVLACLWEKPMYPYEITTTLKERAKDDSIRLNFGSLYSVIRSLEKHGYVAEARAEREGNRPERTVYEITDAGRIEADAWLREIFAVPEKEYPALEAGLSLVAILPPEDVRALLAERVAALDADIAHRTEVLRESESWGLPEVFWVEAYYHVAMERAEREWVAQLVDRLGRGEVGGQEMWSKLHAEMAAGRPPSEVQHELAAQLEKVIEEARTAGGPGPDRARSLPPDPAGRPDLAAAASDLADGSTSDGPAP